MKHQLITITIILCFLGVALAPSINANVDRRLPKSVTNPIFEGTEEITISEYKADGTVEKTIVKLSKEKALEFAEQLKSTDDPEERFSLYKEYGLIPEDVTREHLRQEMLKVAERLGITEEKIESISKRFVHNRGDFRLFGINFLNEIDGIFIVTLNLPIGSSLITGILNYVIYANNMPLLPSADLFNIVIFFLGEYVFSKGLLPDFYTSAFGSFFLLGFVGWIVSTPFLGYVGGIYGYTVASLVIGPLYMGNP